MLMTPAGRRVHVVAVNGGGAPAQNFQSHLVHLAALVGELRRGGVPAHQITVFSGDGGDPAPDLAVRESQPEPDFWLVEGTPLERPLRTPVQLISSVLPGFDLHPATRAALAIWFLTARSRIQAGDTLLLYITDHGARDPGDPEGARITLWGPDESLGTRELGEMLDGLDPGVRVVAVMSQCFSGGFSSLWDGLQEDRAGCGYFSTTRDRRAYGCYPENRGRDNVGHSFLFLRALASSGRPDEAHAETLVGDATPDVPIRTSDRFLERLLTRAANGAPTLYVDELLSRVWQAPERWRDQADLLDRVADRFGMPGPSALATLSLAVGRLESVAAGVEREARRARDRQTELASANLTRFLAAEPRWQTAADQGPARAAFIAALAAFSRSNPPLRAAHELATRMAALSYRTEVRLAAALRLQTLLTRLAGEVYLETRGSDAERRRFQELRECEQTRLPAAPDPDQPEPASETFPSWDQDAAAVEALLPEAPLLARASAPTDDLVAFRGILPGALAGQRRLLAFWATWCKPCQRELPELTALARARGVPLVAITDESAERVAEFFRSLAPPAIENVAIDGARQLFAHYHVTGLPTVLLLSGDGSVESRTTGYSPLNDFGLGAR
jgi:thiol-disulfide isomerase/thioredoxin